MKPAIDVTLFRSKRKTNWQKFESAQRWGPVDFLYLSHGADRKLGQPQALLLTLEPAPSLDPAVLDTIPTQQPSAASKEQEEHVQGFDKA